jgi:hypothetical protein
MTVSKKTHILRSIDFVAVVIVVATMTTGGIAFAQREPGVPDRASTLSGYSGQALRNLYSSDIGTGYTGQSLNNLALQQAQARVPNVGQASSLVDSPAASIGPGLSPRSSKPFSSVSTSPTISPYLNLFNTSRTGSDAFNYQTLVRPQLQQQAINQRQQRENLDIDRKVQALAARSAYNNQAGSDQQVPTGHVTTFMNYGHYYEGGSPHRKRN